jgi:hypothetical protein
MTTPQPMKLITRITLNGCIAERHLSRKSFTCELCKVEIPRGVFYYSVIIAGGGLQSLKFPDRCHEGCVLEFLRR